MKASKIISAVLSAAVLTSTMLGLNINAEENNMKSAEIIIDGQKANTAENMRFRGAGMVSGNNSSRLLLDYKAEHPDKYNEILEYLFGEKGIGITFLKLEMGSDVNSSSGTEPSVKRTADEEADVTRGAGYQLAADAKKINPDLTLDMLWWSEPKWIQESDDVYAARYQWYKETLDAAYETYGLKFDYVSAVQNERAADYDWIKYLSERLKSESDCPYDYSKIKIVGGEEVCTWNFADKMLEDEELLAAVDVVGSHYTSMSSDAAKKLAEEYGKELWFSEGSSSMSYSQGTYRFDGNGSGLGDLNGVLDIANRLIMMYPSGKMTMCELQPVISAYYDGVCYCQKQFINACDPWSGYYYLDSGFFMSLHFSQFMKKGWTYIDDACHADAKIGGDGHALVDSVYSYLTAADLSSGDYSTVITNTTDEPITYNFTVSNLEKASSAVDVWETRGPDSGSYDENYFKKIDTISPSEKDGKSTYSVTVKPYSIVTVSTVETENNYTNAPANERTILALPYSDNYEYEGYAEDYLASRGSAPRYTTDEGGAFEVENIDGNNVLVQQITREIKAKEWGYTPNPTTNFGDDRWYNYSVSADVKLCNTDEPEKNYAGVGLRYNQGHAGESGYWFKLCEDGKYSLMKNKTELESGTTDIDVHEFTTLKISAADGNIKCFIGGNVVIDYTEKDSAVQSAGRASLYSSFNKNMFDNLLVEANENCYITRYDNTDLCCDYSGNWNHTTMGSFKTYKRTSSDGEAGAVMTIKFNGNGFAVTGENKKDAVINVKIDGTEAVNSYAVPNGGLREIAYFAGGLSEGEHTAEIEVVSGTLNVDSVQISGGEIHLTTDVKEEEQPESADTEASETEAEENMTDNSDDTAKPAPKSSVAVPIAVAAVAAAAVAGGYMILKKKKK